MFLKFILYFVCILSNSKIYAFDINDLIKLATSAPVKSIEEIVALLPEEYRKNFQLMYKSQSAQFASRTSPRIILYGPEDSGLTIAISGNPSGVGADSSIEAIQFNKKTDKFEFHELIVSPKRVSLVPGHGQKCMTCHKMNLTPIWGKYDMWPGAYGSKVKDHTDAPNALEREHFAKFINESSHQGVYKHLQGYENYFRRAPAHHLQNLYNEQNFRKIAREIYSHPAYAQNRYAIYAALNNYGGDIENFFTDAQKRGARSFQEVLADTQKNLEEHHQVIVEKEARFSEVEVPSRTTQRQYNTYANWDLHFFEDKVGGNLGDGDPSERHLYKLAKTRYVFEEILKTNISHWSLALEPNSYSQSSTGWVGNPGKEKLGPAKYLEVIDSKIKKLSKNSNLYFMTNDNLIKLHKNPPASTFCERLFGFL